MKVTHPGLMRETTVLFGAGATLVLPAMLGLALLPGHGIAHGTPGNAGPTVVASAPAAPPERAAPQPPTTTSRSTTSHATLSGTGPVLDAATRAEVREALRQMSAEELRLTAARIHAAFRQQLGAADLRPARALIDYARLAEQELHARSLPWPEELPVSAEMEQLFALIL